MIAAEGVDPPLRRAITNLVDAAATLLDRAENAEAEVKRLRADNQKLRDWDERKRLETWRLRQALKVCEHALHARSVIRDDADQDLVHDAQQASGAWCTDWQQPEAEVVDG